MSAMRTTLDIPDTMYRRIKTRTMLSRMDAISCGIFASTLTLPNHDGVFLFRAGECREAGAGSSPSHCEYSTSVMDRTVIPSCAVRVLILRYIVSGMSSVVLMADYYTKPSLPIAIWIYVFMHFHPIGRSMRSSKTAQSRTSPATFLLRSQRVGRG